MADRKIVDLSTKKTEEGWIEVSDRFWLAATPEMFKWLGWVAALAALTFVSQKSNSRVIWLVLLFYYAAMLFYFNAFFFQFAFVNLPFVKNTKVRHLLSLAISGLLALVVGLLANEAARVIGSAKS